MPSIASTWPDCGVAAAEAVAVLLVGPRGGVAVGGGASFGGTTGVVVVLWPVAALA